MKTLSEVLLQQGSGYANNTGVTMNLSVGGQGGQMPALGRTDSGEYAHEWISNHAYVRRNIIPVVLSLPNALQHLPNPEYWVAAYKHLLEVAPLNITGLNSTLTLDSDDHPFGGSGEQQPEPTNATYSQSNITYTYKERAFKSISKFYDKFIRYCIMDPFTKKALVGNLVNSIADFGGAYLPDQYTATVLYIEPDITQLQVVDAWFSTSMYPTTSGDRTGSRDIHSAGETVELSIEFKNITINNEAVHEYAAKVLPTLNNLKYLPDAKMIVQTSIDSNVSAQATGYTGTPGN